MRVLGGCPSCLLLSKEKKQKEGPGEKKSPPGEKGSKGKKNFPKPEPSHNAKDWRTIQHNISCLKWPRKLKGNALHGPHNSRCVLLPPKRGEARVLLYVNLLSPRSLGRVSISHLRAITSKNQGTSCQGCSIFPSAFSCPRNRF